MIAAEADLLRSHGHEVMQWTRQNPEGAAGSVGALLQAPWNRGAAREVAAAARNIRPDVVHVHNTWYATSPSIFSALQHAVDGPVVMTLHNYRLICANGLLMRDGEPCELCVGSGPWNAVRYGCYRDSRVLSVPAAATISLNRRRSSWSDGVDRFLALSQFARSRLIAGGLPSAKVEVKVNFVHDPGPRAVEASDSSQVLYVGRIIAGKGIFTLAEAWRRAAPDGLELVVAGDGPQLEELRSLRVPGIEILGRIDRSAVLELMKQSRALLFPSQFYEGMPMALLESFATGLPVMGSDIGSMTEMLQPLGADWLAQPGAADDWAHHLTMLGDDDAVRAASLTARRLWRDRYGPERALANLENAYRA